MCSNSSGCSNGSAQVHIPQNPYINAVSLQHATGPEFYLDLKEGSYIWALADQDKIRIYLTTSFGQPTELGHIDVDQGSNGQSNFPLNAVALKKTFCWQVHMEFTPTCCDFTLALLSAT